MKFAGINGLGRIGMLFEEAVKFLLPCLGQAIEPGFKGNKDMAEQGIGIFLPACSNVL